MVECHRLRRSVSASYFLSTSGPSTATTGALQQLRLQTAYLKRSTRTRGSGIDVDSARWPNIETSTGIIEIFDSLCRFPMRIFPATIRQAARRPLRGLPSKFPRIRAWRCFTPYPADKTMPMIGRPLVLQTATGCQMPIVLLCPSFGHGMRTGLPGQHGGASATVRLINIFG